MAPNNKHTSGSKRSGHRSERRHARNDSRHKGSHNQHHKKSSKQYFGCGICRADHRLVNCHKFNKMNLAQKYKTAITLHYCVNCLARNHLIGSCTNKARCQQCGGKHHTVLHGPNRILRGLTQERSPSPIPTPRTPPIPAPRQKIAIPKVTTPITTSMTKTFIPTVIVKVGNRIARAILNPTLTKSRIASVFVSESTLTPFKVDQQQFVKALIAPHLESNIRYEICMEVVKELPKTPYPNAMDDSIKDKFKRICLADPEFYSNKPVSVEIGGDLYTTILQPNVIHIDGGSLIAQDSTLGWLVMGSFTQ